jgi:hypothetical protein
VWEGAPVSRRPVDYIRMVISTRTLHPDGTETVEKSPAVWTLAHCGYSGSGRLDIWVYPTKADALRAACCRRCASSSRSTTTTGRIALFAVQR